MGHKWLVHKDEKKYMQQSFVATHKPGKCAVSAWSYQRPVARKSKLHRSPALWAVVTNDLCIRRRRAQSNTVIPGNISDEQPPHYILFLILLSVALDVFVLVLSSKQHRPRREKTCLLGFRESKSQTSPFS